MWAVMPLICALEVPHLWLWSSAWSLPEVVLVHMHASVSHVRPRLHVNTVG